MPAPQLALLKKLFSPDAALVILDIGACDGADSVMYKREFTHATIHAFEPLPRNKILLEEGFTKNGFKDLNAHFFALGKDNGMADFYVSSGAPPEKPYGENWDYGNKSSSFYAPDKVSKTHPWLKFETKIKVEVQRLDSFVAAHKIEAIDFIHLDVQGAELDVLIGAGDFLKNIKAIWLEVENITLYKNQPLRAEVEKFMLTNGFNKIHEENRKNDGDEFWVNNLASPQPLSKGEGQEKRDASYLSMTGVRGVILNGVKELLLKLRSILQPPPPLPSSYAQHGEDLIIQKIFSELKITQPFYLDIGAHHPKNGSNTFLFYREGASGITVEPDEDFYLKHKKERPKDLQLNMAVGVQDARFLLYALSPSTLSTTNTEEAERLQKEGLATLRHSKEVEVIGINKLLEKYVGEKPLHLLSIDAESMDDAIVRGIDFNRFKPTVICVETISYSETGDGVKNESLIKYITGIGYQIHADTGVNTIFVRRE
ncbi:MAG: FkbM family methyltransferase [Bacteroidetes bacterium]|nr:FkbM family methyltransferase [Bacteroidota bacterium]